MLAKNGRTHYKHSDAGGKHIRNCYLQMALTAICATNLRAPISVQSSTPSHAYPIIRLPVSIWNWQDLLRFMKPHIEGVSLFSFTTDGEVGIGCLLGSNTDESSPLQIGIRDQ